MSARSLSVGLALAVGLLGHAFLRGGDEAAAPAPPPAPDGVEVLARGPVHEAFASLAAEPAPTKPVAKRPPKPLDEQPPEEKPEGNVSWIGGYWAWDDDRNDFLWVSGTWRVPPPGKEWVAGYWREEGDNWQWVPGFWTAAAKADAQQQVTYLPAPPTTPPQAPPGQPPIAEAFWVPGHWAWNGDRYAWSAGYWARVEPGYVWVPAHYTWTPGGYVYVAGYWDLAVKRRGLLYAPVVVRPDVVTVSFSYTPVYAVPDTLVVDTLWVRPAYGHYYFGDYYGPAYASLGFQSAYVYSVGHYDSIIVYERYERRADPAWFSVQINLYHDRFAGRAPVPPRTIVNNTTVVNNVTNVTNVTNVNNNVTNVTRNVTNNVTNNNTNVTNNNTTNNVNKAVYNGPTLAPAKQVAAAQGMATTPLSTVARQQVRAQAAQVQQVAAQRTANESVPPGGASSRPRTAALSRTPAQPAAAHPGSYGAAQPAARAATSAGGAQPAGPYGRTAAVAQPQAGPNARTGAPNTGTVPPAPGPRPGQPAMSAAPGQPGQAPANGQSSSTRPKQPPSHRPPPKDRDSHDHH